MRALAGLCAELLEYDEHARPTSTTALLMDERFEDYVDHARCDWDRDYIAVKAATLFNALQ